MTEDWAVGDDNYEDDELDELGAVDVDAELDAEEAEAEEVSAPPELTLEDRTVSFAGKDLISLIFSR